MITNETEYYTVAEAAKLLRVSPPTIWRWIGSGSLPALRVGSRAIRIRRVDLEQALEAARPGVAMKTEPYTIHVGDDGADQQALVQTLEEARRIQLERRGGVPLPSSAEAIRDMRQERASAP